MKRLLFLLSVCAGAQTLGQFRLLDFNPRTVVTIVGAPVGTGPISLTTSGPHGLSTGAAVFIQRNNCTVAQDNGTCNNLDNSKSGNRGRGYYIVSVVDSTHLTITSEMYTGTTTSIANGMAAGDSIIPLTTYYLRQGPRGWLDGPINAGTWNSGANYRSDVMVQAPDTNWYLSIVDGTSGSPNVNHQPPNSTYWAPIDPTKVGPGTFTASLRNTAESISLSSKQ